MIATYSRHSRRFDFDSGFDVVDLYPGWHFCRLLEVSGVESFLSSRWVRGPSTQPAPPGR